AFLAPLADVFSRLLRERRIDSESLRVDDHAVEGFGGSCRYQLVLDVAAHRLGLAVQRVAHPAAAGGGAAIKVAALQAGDDEGRLHLDAAFDFLQLARNAPAAEQLADLRAAVDDE